MASLALGLGGAFIGSFAGPIGTSIGWSLGAAVGARLFAKDQQGPKLTDLKLQNASYGAPIPRGYGTKRISGNVIDQTDLIPHEHESGGKGGPSVTTTSYSASLLIELADCSYIDGEGSLVNTPIVDIKRIWAAGRLIFGPGSPGTTLPMTVYYGTEDQEIDPVFEAIHGVGNQPPYLGKAYVVFEDWDLTQFGNMIPPLEFEVQFTGNVFLEYYSLWNVSWDYPVNSSVYASPYLLNGVDSSIGGQLTLHRYRAGNAYGTVMGTSDDHVVYYDQRTYDLFGNLISEADQIAIVFPATGSPVVLDGSMNNGIAYVSWGEAGVDCSGYHGGETGSNSTEVNTFAWLKDGVVTYTPTVDVYCPAATTAVHGIGAVWSSNMQLGIVGGIVYWNGNVYALGCTVPPGTGEPCIKRYPAPDGAVYTPNYDAIYVLSEYTHDGLTSSAGNLVIGSDGHLYCTVSYFGTPLDPDVLGGHGYKLIKLDADLNFVSAWYGSDFLSASSPIGVSSDFSSVEWQGYWIANHSSIPEYGGYNFAMYRMHPGVGGASGTFGLVDYIATTGIPNDASPPTLAASSPLIHLSGQPLAAFTGGILTLGNGYITLGEIVADVSKQVGYSDTQYDVSQLTDIVRGYVLADRMTGRAAIDTLRPVYQFGAVESDLAIKFRKWKGDIDVTIPDDDLGARSVDEDPPEVDEWTRALEAELPQSIDFLYSNFDMDYQQGEVLRQRQVTESDLHTVVTAPVSMTPDEATKSADMLLINGWVERDKYTTPLPRKYLYLEPIDVISVRGIARRLVNKEEQGYTHVIFDGVAALTSVFISAPTPVPPIGFVPPSIPILQATELRMLDLPLISDSDYANGYYAAMTGTASGTWPGATILKSSDVGVSYTNLLSTTFANTIGRATTTLGNFGGGNIFDELNSVTVVLTLGSPALTSSTELGVLNGVNTAVIGSEIIRFKTATLIGTGTYKLSGLLRGRRGTEWAIGTHAGNENFALLPVINIEGPFAELGSSRLFKGVTIGRTLDSATAVPFTNTGIALKEYAPAHLGGGRNAAGDITLRWTSRAKKHGAWLDNADVPFADLPHDFLLTVYTSNTYATVKFQAAAIAATTYTYTAADQTIDFGSPQATLYWDIAAYGTNGLGYSTRGAT